MHNLVRAMLRACYSESFPVLNCVSYSVFLLNMLLLKKQSKIQNLRDTQKTDCTKVHILPVESLSVTFVKFKQGQYIHTEIQTN